MKIDSIVAVEPHYFIIKGKVEQDELLDSLFLTITSGNIDELIFEENEESLHLGKYDEFVPLDLIQKAFIADGLDLKSIAHSLQEYKKFYGDSTILRKRKFSI
ncbi:hypothetical protein WGM54_18605 [Paenibacillus polymyxa]|uniref:hypothetical protein n=1 Tax=Paenibacillus polymyxa TaxID=1406 RepID=UPI00307F27CB